jgi:alpha-2-macroglobulin
MNNRKHLKPFISQSLFALFFVLLSCSASSSPREANQEAEKQTVRDIRREQSPKVVSFEYNHDRYNPSFEIRFDQGMVALGSNRTFNHKSLIKFEPAIDCEWFWDDSKRLKCNLEDESKLQLATRYQVTVSEKLTDFKGQSIPRFQQQFETERPYLLTGNRSDFNINWLEPTLPIINIEFNQPVALKSLQNKFALVAANNKQLIALDISHNEKRIYQESDNNKYFIIKPRQALAADTQYQISLKPGYRSLLGDLSGTKAFNQSFRTFADFEFVGIACESSHYRNSIDITPPCAHGNNVVLKFNGAVDKNQTIKTLDADDRLAWFFKQNYWWVENSQDIYKYTLPTNQLEPASTQVFNLTKAIVDQFGRPLSNPVTVDIAIGDAEQHASIIPLTVTTDVDTAHPKLRTVQTPVIKSEVTILTDTGAQILKNKHTTDKDKLNIAQQHEVLPSELISTSFYADINYEVFEEHLSNRNATVISTSFQMLALRTKKGVDVSVLDIKTLEPIRHATVKLIDLKQTLINVRDKGMTSRKALVVIAKAKSDSEGLASIKIKFDSNQPFKAKEYAILVTKGRKQSKKVGFLPLDGYLSTTMPEDYDYISFLLQERRGYEDYKPEYLVFGFTDKSLYKPGDTIRFKGYVRLKDDNQFTLAKGLHSITAKIESYDMPTIKTQAIKLNEFGAFDHQIKLPTNAPDDEYWLEISSAEDEDIGQFKFTVATIKPKETDVQAKISSHPNGQPVFGRDPIEVNVNASYYSGGPVIGHDVKINISLDDFEYTQIYPKYADYSFDARDGGYNDFYNQDGLVTDSVGSHLLTLQMPEVKQELGILNIETAVKNSQGGWQAAEIQEKAFFKRKLFVGIKEEGWYQKVNQDIQFSSIVVDYLGQTIKDMPIQVELFYQEVETTADTDVGQKASSRSWKSLGSCTASLVDQQEPLPRYTCPLQAQQQGRYRITAQINPKDESSYSSSIEFYAYDFDGDSKSDSNLDSKELKFKIEQASEFRQGEDNQLILLSPFKRSRVLVAYGRAKQFKVQMVDMDTPAFTLPIKLQGIHTPAFDVTIYAVDISTSSVNGAGSTEAGSNGPGSNEASIIMRASKDQVVTLRKTFEVAASAKSEQIRIRTEKSKYQPGESVTLSLKSKKRKRLEYAIAVIDKAKLSYLENYQEYYQPRQSSLYRDLSDWYAVPSFNLLQHLGANDMFDEKEKIQVTGSRMRRADLGVPLRDGDSNSNKTSLDIRSLFKDSAAWHPSLVSDRHGKAKFKFTLPDNLTTWAIFVVATDKKGQFYDQSMEIISTQEIEMRAQVPAQVVKGDQFNPQFSVVNKTDKPANIQATIERQHSHSQPQSQSQLDTESSAASQTKVLSKDTLHLAPYHSAQIKATIDVDTTDTIKLVAHAHSHEHSDAIVAEIPVLDTVQFETIHKPFITHERLSVPVVFPEMSVSNVAELSISASTNSISQLKGALIYLRDYPHRCWEQQLSRAIGYAYHQQLQKRGINLLTWEEGDLVNDTLNKSKLYQAPNGGFAFFIADDARVSRYLSNVTAMSFVWLQTLGYHASEQVQKHLIRYQNQLVTEFLSATQKSDTDVKPGTNQRRYWRDMSLLLASRAKDTSSSSKHISPSVGSSEARASEPANKKRKTTPDKRTTERKSAFGRIVAHVNELSLSSLANLYHASLAYDLTKSASILAAIQQKLPLSGEKLSLDKLNESGYFYGVTTSLCNTLSGLTAHTRTLKTGNNASNAAEGVAKNQSEQALLEWKNRLRRTILGQKRPYGDFGSTQKNVWCLQAIVGNIEESTQPNQIAIEFANQSHSLKIEQHESTQSFSAKLTPEPQSLDIKTVYKRPVYLDIALKYPIDTSTAKPAAHGLSIQRIYQVYRANQWHEVTPNMALNIGEWIKVSLKIYNPELRQYIAVSDPNAGGLTPISTSLLATVPGYITRDARNSGVFYQQQIAPTTSRFYADHLRKGHYQIDYFAQVTNQGRFSALPAVVEEMYNDDHKGRTAMQVLIVD